MLRLRHVAPVFALFALACSDSPSGPSTSESTVLTQDLADLAADGAAEDVGVMLGMDGQIAAFPSAASLLDGRGTPRVNGCTPNGGSFHCAKVRQNGLDVERTVTFFDAEGATQAAYNNRTTASIHVVVSVEGEVTRGPWTASIERSRDMTFTGLVGAETSRTANGTGAEETSRSGERRDGSVRGYSVVGTSSLVNVVFPVHSEDADQWPLSGTSTRSFTITPLTGEPKTKVVVINFNGTANPTGTVDGEPFTFDLTNRRGHRRD